VVAVLARVRSCALVGIDAYFVEVEVDVSRGLPSFSTVGLPDAAVRESRERVLSAIKNSGLELPPRKIVVNLAPADTRKEGAGFDLAVAVGLLRATGQLSGGQPPGERTFGGRTRDETSCGRAVERAPCSRTENGAHCGRTSDEAPCDKDGDAMDGWVFVGELSLDGRVRPVRGALSMALLAKEASVLGMVVPTENGDEASVALGEKVLTARTLLEVVRFFRGEIKLETPLSASRQVRSSAPEQTLGGDVGATAMGGTPGVPPSPSFASPTPPPGSEFPKRLRACPDFSDVRGQHHVRRALEVAAAGNHNVIMIGPPGSGKTMLAKRVPSILPPLTIDEAIETTRIYSAAGRLRRGVALLSSRPFRSPHHTVSTAGAIGGGKVPRPGEVSLAHNGVLFLDELPEFRHDVLEALRQPLEEGNLTISRAGGTVLFPARFMLIAASNPCPCGYFTDPLKECKCTPIQIRNYMGRLSGPLLDRIDIHVSVPRVSFREISQERASENSSSIIGRVLKARTLQLRRYADLSGIRTNSDLGENLIKSFCIVDESGLSMLRAAMERLALSGRAFHRILKVARTIADLDGAELPRAEHVAEAIQYRSLDRMQR
jgi:magnesium chelatase family protein